MNTLSSLARRIIAFILFTTLLPVAQASALTEIYDVYETTGDPIELDNPTQIYGSGEGESASDLINIGFDFHLDGVRYTQFSVSTAGLMSLGVRTESDDEDTHYFPGNSNIDDHYPLIAPYWGEDLETSNDGGSIRYKVSGSAPFRVLTVEWNDLQEFGSSSTHYDTFQVRLYESTNRIEFWYGATLPTAMRRLRFREPRWGSAGRSTRTGPPHAHPPAQPPEASGAKYRRPRPERLPQQRQSSRRYDRTRRGIVR